MSEFSVEVEIIRIEKHPNADSLSIAYVRGDYPVIFKTGQFKLGDKAVYVPVDSVVPEGDPRWDFLAGHRRIKAKKLRGVFSMGLLTEADPSWTVGQNVQDLLNITKYEPDMRLCMAGQDEKDPGFLPVYTDIEGLRRHPNVLVEGEVVVITEKLHGCLTLSTRIWMADGSKKRIVDVQPGDEVFGMDTDGRVVATPVMQTFNNGKAAAGWLRRDERRARECRCREHAAARRDHARRCARTVGVLLREVAMTRYRDPTTLDNPRWPQTGLRVGETDDHRRTFWIRRIPTQGRTVYWRVLEYLDETLTHSQDYASLRWHRTESEGQ